MQNSIEKNVLNTIQKNSMWCADGTFNGRGVVNCSMPSKTGRLTGLFVQDKQAVVFGNSVIATSEPMYGFNNSPDLKQLHLVGVQPTGTVPPKVPTDIFPRSGSLFTSDAIVTNDLSVGDLKLHAGNNQYVNLRDHLRESMGQLQNIVRSYDIRLRELEKRYGIPDHANAKRIV